MNEVKWEPYRGGLRAEILRHADRNSSVLCFVLRSLDDNLFRISFFTKEDTLGYDLIHQSTHKHIDIDTAKAAAEIKIHRLLKILHE